MQRSKSFAWAVSDPKFRHEQPWRFETFRGYFTDIQRAARRSLPRQPSQDLCMILGLTVSPEDLQLSGASGEKRKVSFTGGNTPSTPPTDLVPVPPAVEKPPDHSRAVAKTVSSVIVLYVYACPSDTCLQYFFF